MSSRHLLFASLAALSLAATGCGTSLSELQARVQASRDCTKTTDCALSAASDCTCAYAVNKTGLDDVNSDVESASCGDTKVTCSAGDPLTCANGVCHGDAIATITAAQ